MCTSTFRAAASHSALASPSACAPRGTVVDSFASIFQPYDRSDELPRAASCRSTSDIRYRAILAVKGGVGDCVLIFEGPLPGRSVARTLFPHWRQL